MISRVTGRFLRSGERAQPYELESTPQQELWRTRKDRVERNQIMLYYCQKKKMILTQYAII